MCYITAHYPAAAQSLTSQDVLLTELKAVLWGRQLISFELEEFPASFGFVLTGVMLFTF